MVGVGEGAGLIREWPLVGEARRPNWLSSGLHPAGTPPPYLFIPCPPETLGVEKGQGVGKIPLHPLPALSPECSRGVELP